MNAQNKKCPLENSYAQMIEHSYDKQQTEGSFRIHKAPHCLLPLQLFCPTPLNIIYLRGICTIAFPDWGLFFYKWT